MTPPKYAPALSVIRKFGGLPSESEILNFLGFNPYVLYLISISELSFPYLTIFHFYQTINTHHELKLNIRLNFGPYILEIPSKINVTASRSTLTFQEVGVVSVLYCT